MKVAVRLLQSALLSALVFVGVLLSATPGLAQSAMRYRELGIAARDRGDLPGAIAHFRQAVKLDPENLGGQINLGWTLHLAKQEREAAAVLEKAIWIDPYHAPTFNALGIVYLTNNDLLRAVLTHSWAAFIKPANEIAHFNLSLAYQRLKQYDRAIAEAKTAIPLEPQNPHPLLALAIAHAAKGDRAQSQQAYRQAIELDARYGEFSFLRELAMAGFSDRQIAETGKILEDLR